MSSFFKNIGERAEEHQELRLLQIETSFYNPLQILFHISY